MSVFLPAPSRPPAKYSADDEAQYRLGIAQVLRRMATLLGVATVNAVSVSTAYQMTIGDGVIRANTTSAGFTVTLQPSATVKGQVVHIKKTSTDGNTLTVDGSGAELIDGSATLAWATARLNHTFYANGTGWDVLT